MTPEEKKAAIREKLERIMLLQPTACLYAFAFIDDQGRPAVRVGGFGTGTEHTELLALIVKDTSKKLSKEAA